MSRVEPEYADKVIPMTQWIHTKSGNTYIVVGNCFIEATCTQAVMYEREGFVDPVVWVRPIDEFRDRFKSIIDGKLPPMINQ
jgi:hypothetical protein